MQWWEKTVEYQFILDVGRIEKYRDFLAPLDSSLERAGDALFAKNNRWILIEFKKDRSCIERERSKFSNFDNLKRELGSGDDHHYIVYGSIDPDSSKFALSARTYFSGKHRKSLDEVFNSGLGIEQFSNYLRRFTPKTKSDSTSASGGLDIRDYSLVAGVSPNGSAIGCMTVTEYALTMGISLGMDLPPPPMGDIDRGIRRSISR